MAPFTAQRKRASDGLLAIGLILSTSKCSLA